MILIEFEGASVSVLDGVKEYTPRGKIFINPDRVQAIYDHTIITGDNQIRVMEDIDKIRMKLGMTGKLAIENGLWKEVR